MAKSKRLFLRSPVPMKVSIPWYRRFPWLAVAGSILIFVSWVFENKYASEATEERLRLERSQIAVDIQQMRMEQWQILYLQERSKKDPDQTILLAALFKTLQSYANLAGWSFARVRDDPVEAGTDISEKNRVLQNLIRLYKAGDIAALEKDLKNVLALESQLRITETLTEKFQQRYAKVEASEERLRWFFLITYAIGTVMIGLDFMLKRKQQESGVSV